MGIIATVSRLATKYVPLHHAFGDQFDLDFYLSIVYYISIAIPLGWLLVVKPQVNNALKETEKFLAVLEAAPEGVLVVDTNGRIALANKETEKIFGYPREELFGTAIERLIPARFNEQHQRHRKNYAAAPYTRAMGAGLDLLALRKDGTEFPAAVSISHMDDGGSPLIICVVRDVTVQRHARESAIAVNQKLTQSLRALEELSGETEHISNFSEMLHASSNLTEASSVISWFCQTAFPEQMGAVYLATSSRNTMEKLVSWGCTDCHLHELLTTEGCWAVRRGRPHGEQQEPCEACMASPDGMASGGKLCVPMVAHGELIGVFQVSKRSSVREHSTDNAGTSTEVNTRSIGAIAERISSAISNLKLRNALQEQATRDPLMGLFNRRYMEESLEREITRASRGGTFNEDKPLTFLMLDVDHFKRFNDSYGHSAGDAVLSQLGNLLRGLIRGTDIPCRYGGEELAVLLPECTLESGLARAEQLRKTVESLVVVHGGNSLGAITISIGLACAPVHATTATELVRAADLALYEAKKHGRNQVVIAGSEESPSAALVKQSPELHHV